MNLFTRGSATIDIGGRAVTVKQETRYPWEGAVKIILEPEKTREFRVYVRLPGCAQNRPVPTDLYRYLES